MTSTERPYDRLSRALSSPAGGVLALVSELLAVVTEQPLDLAWEHGRWIVRLPRDQETDPIAVELPRSVDRAVLARVATLCNDCEPESVWSHGGGGMLLIQDPAPVPLSVVFVNTPSEQRLSLIPETPGSDRQVNP